jgi:hypothetical protein
MKTQVAYFISFETGSKNQTLSCYLILKGIRCLELILESIKLHGVFNNNFTKQVEDPSCDSFVIKTLIKALCN